MLCDKRVSLEPLYSLNNSVTFSIFSLGVIYFSPPDTDKSKCMYY